MKVYGNTFELYKIISKTSNHLDIPKFFSPIDAHMKAFVTKHVKQDFPWILILTISSQLKIFKVYEYYKVFIKLQGTMSKKRTHLFDREHAVRKRS